VTARIPPSVPVVREFGRRLMLWLHRNGHTKLRSVRQFLAENEKSSHQQPKGSQAAIVVAAMSAAFLVLGTINNPTRLRTIAKVRVVRSQVKGLRDELAALDRLNAKNAVTAKSRTFSDLGVDALRAIDAIAGSLEVVQDVRAPSSRASWSAFVGDFAVKLGRAGMPAKEVRKLVDGATRATKSASLRRHSSRIARRADPGGDVGRK